MRPSEALFGSHRVRKSADSIVVNEATKPALRDVGRTPTLSPSEPPERRSTVETVLRVAAGALTVAALLACGVLLLSDAAPELSALVKFVVAMAPRAWALLGHAPLSAMPLLLAGGSYIALQGLLRPPPIELVKRLLLGSAFLLWGIVQLMPPSVIATDLGDLVIALYVLDLGIIIQAELREA
jgi:hypothetical protein